MKLQLLTIALSFSLFAGVANAQSLTPEEKLNFETREMAQKLGLNEFGYIQLKQLNVEKQLKAREIIAEYSYDLPLRNLKLSELNKNYDLQLRGFLKPRQLEAYMALNANLNPFIAGEKY